MKNISKKMKISIALAGLGVLIGIFFTNCAKSGFNAAGEGLKGSDPLLEMAWYIHNTSQKVFSSEAGEAGNDLNLLKTWGSGTSGKGIKILISDDGVEDTHEDLKGNYLLSGVSKDYTLAAPYLADTASPIGSDDDHGTAVAGLVAAVADNGVGVKGIAYEASIASANFLSSVVTQTTAMLVDQADGDYDIFNMSWGSTQNKLSPVISPFHSQLKAGVTSGRSGRGAIYVKAAGNDFAVLCNNSSSEYCVGNSNFDSDNTTPFMIVTSALNAGGYAASYSSVGSNVWISSFGGESGDDAPAMITTDRSSCSKGFAMSNIAGKVAFERGAFGNTSCNYTAVFNGTSAAAPILSGAIALILQANPNLTWRDVKYILAKTAVPPRYTTSGSIPHPNEQTPSGYVWEQAWVVNKAGFKFHNWYGFGRVDVDAAVTMAKTYSSAFGGFVETNWVDERSGLTLPIPDNSATGVSDSMIVVSDIKIEAVQLKVWVTHTNISDLALELTSPSGTKSIVINLNNALRGIGDYQGEVFLTNAFYQERSAGNWTLKVIDGTSTHSGTLTRWSLNFSGSY